MLNIKLIAILNCIFVSGNGFIRLRIREVLSGFGMGIIISWLLSIYRFLGLL